MSFNTTTTSNHCVDQIIKTQFGLCNPHELEQGSVCEIKFPETYDNGIPKEGGLLDLRMGVTELEYECETCKHNSNDCVGHFGHIKLVIPVFHIHFIKETIKLLRCVCVKCSNLLIDKSGLDMEYIMSLSNKHRFEYIFSLCNIAHGKNHRKCNYNNGCNIIQPIKYIKLSADRIKDKDNVIKIEMEFPPGAFNSININTKQDVTPDMCLKVFSKITDEDANILGFDPNNSRPEWMICTVLPVCPPCDRPSINHPDQQRSEDDITLKLIEIVKANLVIQQKIEAGLPKKKIDEYCGWLQYHIGTLIDNEGFGKNMLAIGRYMRPLKVYKQRLSGKEGRLRHNMMGKRVNHSGRTVISVDPTISIDEFGVPLSICMNLTYPEIVTKYNIERVSELVKNGHYVYPGAKSVDRAIRNDNGEIINYVSIRLAYLVNANKKNINTELQIGDIVHRHLQNGDYALFNRQPSLHRMSMMAHKIKVMKKGSTFRLNVYVTEPYNADFDGDEMNMHVPQNSMSRIELSTLAAVDTQIIGPAKGKPVIAVKQDTMIGGYLFTKGNTLISKSFAMDLLMMLNDFDNNYDKGKIEYVDGRTVYSKLLPEFGLESPNSSYNDELPDDPLYTENMVIIKNGILTQGTLDSRLLGDKANGLVHNIYNMYNKTVCKNYLNDHQRLITKWLENTGFTIGVGDMIINDDLYTQKCKIVQDKIAEVNNLLKEVEDGVYNSNLSDTNMMKSLEADIMNILSQARDESGKIVYKNMDPNNRIYQIVTSGSKGKPINISQISSCVGQQDIWGFRPKYGYTDRTLPHYYKNDYSAASRGFIANAFIDGLTPAEYFFAAMGGRIGVIDTAIKTADTGYLQRRLVKALESIKVANNGVVQSSNGQIVQFSYNSDSMDPIKLESCKLFIIGLNDTQLEKQYKFDLGNIKDEWYSYIEKNVVDELFKVSDFNDKLENEYIFLKQSRDILRQTYYNNLNVMNVKILSPINFYRLIQSVRFKFEIQECDISKLNPLYVIDSINTLLHDFRKYDNITMTIFDILCKSYLSSKQCIMKYKFTVEAFDYMLHSIRTKFFASFINPGEMVGAIAAQSIGEVSTQLTLNTFHLAGTGATVTSSGVPRLKEIISLSPKIMTPSISIYLKTDYSLDNKYANDMVNQLEYTKICDIVLKSQILFESDDTGGVLYEDQEFIMNYNLFNNVLGDDCVKNNSPWILRLIFDKEQMITKDIVMSKVKSIILNQCIKKNNVHCVFSDDNANELVMRIKVNYGSDDNYVTELKDLSKDILNMTLRGVPNITMASVAHNNIISYIEDGSYLTNKENIIQTEGSNFIKVIENDVNEHIDIIRTISNDICEMSAIFGIEATRNLIIKELCSVLEIDPGYERHVELLADMMCYRGEILKISRHGINKSDDNGPFHKASFEEVPEILSKAGIFAEVDNMDGTSANIIMGQMVNAGTHAFDVVLNEEALMEYAEDGDDDDEKQDSFEDLYKEAYGEYEDIATISFIYDFNNNMQYHISPLVTEHLAFIVI
jgi:DNA-directed RNA polymerase II subunit RPB1